MENRKIVLALILAALTAMAVSYVDSAPHWKCADNLNVPLCRP